MDDSGIEVDMSRKMEDEHLRLSRQVRVIQSDRMQRTTGVHPQFRRQDALLKRLKREYVNLCMDLKIARSGAHKKKDKKMRQDLNNALLYMIQTENNCDDVLTSTNQIESLIARNYKENLELKKLTMASEGKLSDRQKQSEVRLMCTENKLQNATLRYNAIQNENKQIRAEIEHMLKDRQLFNQSWEKMLSALRKGKKFLLDLFESTTLAYDQREEWCSKLRTMQEKGKIDQILQVQEMRDLIKAYDHEMKLYHFYDTKGVTRINKKQEEREAEEKKKEEEEKLEKIDYHMNLLSDICNYTGKSREQQVIQQFVKIECENFATYKRMSELCAENEFLARDVKAIRQEAVDRHDWNLMMEEKRQAKLKRLQEQLEVQQQKTEKLRRLNEEKTAFVDHTMAAIVDMFSMLNCSLDPFQNLLGDKQPSIHQLHLTTTLITQKIKEYKEIIYYFERCLQKKINKTSSSRLKKYTVHPEIREQFVPTPITVKVPAHPCPSCVQTRWLSRITDKPELPFDKQMALQALQQLCEDPAYLRSDRVHVLTECKLPKSRAILARRYLNM